MTMTGKHFLTIHTCVYKAQTIKRKVEKFNYIKIAIIYLSEVSKQSEKYKPQIETRDINYSQNLFCRIYKECYN